MDPYFVRYSRKCIDPCHPWRRLFGDGLAACVCCGSAIKRAVVVGGEMVDDIPVGGEVYGLDCYARLFDATRIRARIRKADKARKSMEDAITSWFLPLTKAKGALGAGHAKALDWRRRHLAGCIDNDADLTASDAVELRALLAEAVATIEARIGVAA